MFLIFAQTPTTSPIFQSYHTTTIVHNSLAIMLNLENGPSSTPLRSTARPQYQQSPGPAYQITPGPYSGHDSDSFTSVRDPRGMRTRQLRENFFRDTQPRIWRDFFVCVHFHFPIFAGSGNRWLWVADRRENIASSAKDEIYLSSPRVDIVADNEKSNYADPGPQTTNFRKWTRVGIFHKNSGH